MDLTGYSKILLFGGSFDPPHRAHLEQPEAVRRAIGADVVAYMPAARAPHKLDREQTPAEHRLAMLRLALAECPTVVVLTDELDRFASTGQPSYTVQTLEALLPRLAPDAQLHLLIGADQARIFDTWREHERIIKLGDPVVMTRPPDELSDLGETWQRRAVAVDPIDLSSSELRQRVADGEPIVPDVPPTVAAYIQQHGLYSSSD